MHEQDSCPLTHGVGVQVTDDFGTFTVFPHRSAKR
jgi:hypothetical protein